MKFVLRDCQFDGVDGWLPGRHHLDAQFYFLDCTFPKTTADKPIGWVIYPDDPQCNANLDKSNIWGEREYFHNCHCTGGDFDWFTNNLATVPGSPRPDRITAAWTFAGKWNPEDAPGPTIRHIQASAHQITVELGESVTFQGKPRLKLDNGRMADYVVAVGAGVASGPRTDPSGQDYRTRLLS